jgi:predicted lipoprotein with Yx(FWY)xxD motif
VLVLGVVAVLLGACGGSSSKDNGPGSSGGQSSPKVKPGGVAVLTVNTDDVQGIGTVLVDARGFTLYHLDGDSASDIQCTGDCTSTWPPLLLTTQGPTGGVQVTGTLDTVSRPDGGEQVTYEGELLYTYSGDTKPGEATGDGVGGVWHAATPDDSGSGGSGGGYGSGGYGY